jgi:hypothetical protein
LVVTRSAGAATAGHTTLAGDVKVQYAEGEAASAPRVPAPISRPKPSSAANDKVFVMACILFICTGGVVAVCKACPPMHDAHMKVPSLLLQCTILETIIPLSGTRAVMA